VALREKIVSVEAKDEDFGSSKARTTTKDETIFAVTRRDGADFPDFCVSRRQQTPGMRHSFFLELEKNRLPSPPIPVVLTGPNTGKKGFAMFCYQCEQTSQGQGCQTIGVCGKDENTATLQDLLIHAVKGISQYAHWARTLNAADPEVDAFTIEAIFATLTNVNFDEDRVADLIYRAAEIRNQAKALYQSAASKAGVTAEILGGPAAWQPATTRQALLAQGQEQLIPAAFLNGNKETKNLEELIIYGIKGVAAYAYHAMALGSSAPASYAKVHEIMAALTQQQSIEALLGLAMQVGELNYAVLEQLDRAHVETFGAPTPASVRVHPVSGKAILVSGHDLHDLYQLLVQTEGLGINIYTHGEMLPAHGYPKLKAFKHLAGNYGGAWVDQADEFDAFPGAILMTSNCIQKPKESYQGRIFTAGPVQWPGVQHISASANGAVDFSPVIKAALAAPGFKQDGPDESITVGFGHDAVLGVAGTVIEAVKSGALRRFFLIGGCDGARSGRNYYTELAEKVPQDCVILTLACGKFRFNKKEFGTLGGLPRLLDMGQCNDAFSALKVAQALAGAFNCGVNDLPLSLVLSWYEQKAVSILLTLLWLGVKNIRIGPTLPAFITPSVLELLNKNYNLMPTTTVDADLAAILN
jgi:hydroxylamine reductase